MQSSYLLYKLPKKSKSGYKFILFGYSNYFGLFYKSKILNFNKILM